MLRRDQGVRRARIEPERLRTLIRLVWQASTVAWIGGGVLLLAAPWIGSETARALDRRHARLRVRLLGLRQCVGHARPAFRLDRASTRVVGASGSCRLLAQLRSSGP